MLSHTKLTQATNSNKKGKDEINWKSHWILNPSNELLGAWKHPKWSENAWAQDHNFEGGIIPPDGFTAV